MISESLQYPHVFSAMILASVPNKTNITRTTPDFLLMRVLPCENPSKKNSVPGRLSNSRPKMLPSSSREARVPSPPAPKALPSSPSPAPGATTSPRNWGRTESGRGPKQPKKGRGAQLPFLQHHTGAWLPPHPATQTRQSAFAFISPHGSWCSLFPSRLLQVFCRERPCDEKFYRGREGGATFLGAFWPLPLPL